jgi:2-polyprenyl-3-methyl-5-hydroxy-6-metoxy-1,4-benzoquinol methylase
MNSKHWDKLANTFEKEVMSSLHTDKSRVLYKAIRKYISKKDHVADLGCGVGGFIPLLSVCGKKISACDFSPKCIEVAKKKYKKTKNTNFFVHDLTKPLKEKYDVGIAANVLLAHEPPMLKKMLQNMADSIKKGGYLIVVIPSLESSLYVYKTIVDVLIQQGETSAAAKKYVDEKIAEDYISLTDGIIKVGDVPTKHYIAEEFEAQLLKFNMEVVQRKKLKYPWDTEIESPPKNLKGSGPWDWMFVGRKK